MFGLNIFGNFSRRKVGIDYQTQIEKLKKNKKKFLIELRKEIEFRKKRELTLVYNKDNTYGTTFLICFDVNLNDLIALYEHQKDLIGMVKTLFSTFKSLNKDNMSESATFQELGLDEKSKETFMKYVDKSIDFHRRNNIDNTCLDPLLEKTSSILIFLKEQRNILDNKGVDLNQLYRKLREHTKWEKNFEKEKIEPLLRDYTKLHDDFFKFLKSSGALGIFNRYYGRSKEEIEDIIEVMTLDSRLAVYLMPVFVVLMFSTVLDLKITGAFFIFLSGSFFLIELFKQRLEKTLNVLQLSN